MVSWGFAFRKGFLILLWSILWGVIGGIIAIAVSGGAVFAAIMSGSVERITGAFATMMLGTIIGAVISSIGAYASIVKVVVESTIEEQDKMGTRMCPQCGRKIATDLKFCPHCGKNFTAS